jgi:hypothetical protein
MMLCACGRKMRPRQKRCDRCRVKAAQARYEKTEKGKATHLRYANGNGIEMRRLSAGKRLFIGEKYIGRAATVELAEQINAHVRTRVGAFREGQRELAPHEAAPLTKGSPC